MRAIFVCAVVALVGCSGIPLIGGGSDSDEAPPTVGSEGRPPMASWADVEASSGVATADADLPEAPWQAEPMPNDQAPAELVTAWRDADNRDWCAPLSPSADGARARPARYAGGWAVEFDKAGMPGVSRNGHRCERCGRGAFGIAGTAVMVDEEDPTEAEERGFRDGSRVRIEVPVDEEDVDEVTGHVATVKIQGQECVYQVWSLAGDEHLEELVNQLRFVTPD